MNQQMSPQSTHTICHEATVFTEQLQLWPFLVELPVLLQIFLADGHEATSVAHERLEAALERHVVLADMQLQVGVLSGAGEVTQRAAHLLLLMRIHTHVKS